MVGVVCGGEMEGDGGMTHARPAVFLLYGSTVGDGPPSLATPESGSAVGDRAERGPPCPHSR